MQYVNLNRDTILVGEVIDTTKQFRMGYHPDLNFYIMIVHIDWICDYERYYMVPKSDYDFYLRDKVGFYVKYHRELGRNDANCFTDKFVGSASLRDYDGIKGFQGLYPARNVNAFQCYLYWNGILYARIVWEDFEIYVPPVVEIKIDGKSVFPLRKYCEIQYDVKNNPICNKLKRSFVFEHENWYTYQGESEAELQQKLIKTGSISTVDSGVFLEKPYGTIFVGTDVAYDWLKNRKSFIGWNIQLVDVCKDEIKLE